LYSATAKYLEKMGYKIKLLNIDDMEHSCCYNPFNYIRNDDDVTDMCQVFMENTNGDNGVQKGDFWDKMTMIQLEALCFLIRATYPKENQNWYEVANLLRQAIPEKDEDGNPIPTEVDKKMEALNRADEGHIAYLKWLDFKSIAKNDETVANAVGSTIARITRFSNRNIKNLTSFDTVHLEDIGKEKTALFCLTKAANSTYNFIMGMCYMQLFQTLEAVGRQNGGKLPVYTRFILDEFANICKIPKFDEWLSYIRSFGVSITIIIQTYAQLEKIYDKAADIITGNCDFTLFLGTTDEKVAKKISERLGKATIYRKEHVKGSQYKRVSMQRDLMTTDEVLAMKTDECILFCARQKPIFDKKIKTWELPNFKYTYDSTHDMKDWADPSDFKSVTKVYEELKEARAQQKSVEQPIAESEIVSEEKPIVTAKEVIPKKQDLNTMISERDRTVDEARIEALSSNEKVEVTKSEISEFVSDNFVNSAQMEESVYVINTFNPEFEMDSSVDIANLINDFLNPSTIAKAEEDVEYEEDLSSYDYTDDFDFSPSEEEEIEIEIPDVDFDFPGVSEDEFLV
jgi:type IV secretory pathway TraG/TraD family ATPase VirD4